MDFKPSWVAYTVTVWSNLITLINAPLEYDSVWTVESMESALNSTHHENKGLREAARMYNIPVETLRRHANGSVEAGCKPGPSTVLTDEEEDRLATYLVEMTDMGFSLSRDTVMELAFTTVEKSQRKHPFRDSQADRAWLKDLGDVTLSYLFTLHSHCLIVEHSAPTKRRLMSSLSTSTSF